MKRLITYSCMAIFAMGSMAQNQKDEAQMNRFHIRSDEKDDTGRKSGAVKPMFRWICHRSR